MGKVNAVGLHKALKKLNLKAPSGKIWEKFKLDFLPMAPSGGTITSPRDERDIRKGFFPVYVGDEAKRYLVSLRHLKHPMFLKLLRLAAEEFGFNGGELRIPCDPEEFERLQSFIGKSYDTANGLPTD